MQLFGSTPAWYTLGPRLHPSDTYTHTSLSHTGDYKMQHI